jgi:hypothetical protein
MDISFPVSPLVDSAIAKSERGEEPSGGGIRRLDSDPFSNAEFGKNLANLSNQFAASADGRLPVPKMQSAFHPLAQRNAFRSDARQQSRSFALESPKLTHSPQLHPALQRLSPIVSQAKSVAS